MDDRFNTFAGWALFAGIIALGGGIVASKMIHTERPEEMGYAIQGVEAEGEGGAAGPSLNTLLAKADQLFLAAQDQAKERFTTFYFVGMARFYRAAIHHRTFREVVIRPSEATMSEDFARKFALLEQAQAGYVGRAGIVGQRLFVDRGPAGQRRMVFPDSEDGPLGNQQRTFPGLAIQTQNIHHDLIFERVG